MVHLMLDTNIWLYITNNFINNYKGDSHVQLFNKLVKSQNDGLITIYINEIITKEWGRNQVVQREYIKKLENRLTSKLELNALEDIIGNTEALTAVRKEFTNQLDTLIEGNEKHIKRVAEFISQCKTIPIETAHKVKTIDLAIDNKAPFHKNKNNVNDALILFCFDSFVNKLLLTPYDAAYLVSHNKEEYCEDKKGIVFHKEITKELSSDILYGDYLKLWEILELSRELQAKLNKEIKEWEDCNEELDYICPSCHWNEYGEGDMKNQMSIIFASDVVSKIQLNLFAEEEFKYKAPDYRFKDGLWDTCTLCGNGYFICPFCGNTVSFNDDNCSECGTAFSVRKNNNGYSMYVKDI